MHADTLVKQVNERQRQQSFDLFDTSNNYEEGLDDIFLFSNQFAYKVDCETTEIIEIRGNLKELTGIDHMETLEVLQGRIKNNLLDKYVEETMASFSFMIGHEDRIKPLRNTFSSVLEIETGNRKRKTFYRQVFSLKSDINGIMAYTGGICTHIEGLKSSPVSFEQHKCIGPEGIYYRNEKLQHFSNLFSFRELEVLKHIADGYKTRTIAEMLFISVQTVETHRKKMLKKLEAKSTPHMVALAKDMGLI